MALVSGDPLATKAADGSRGGFTLTELLIAAALSLVVMGAVASLFGILSRSIRQSQSTVDLSALMRSAAWQLRQDLTGITCAVAPWSSPETNSGYFELIEGPTRDISFAIDSQGLPTTNVTADTDDILLFTTQSLAESFVGRYEGAMVESPYAEVAWFCRPSANQPVDGTTLYDLHRRQLLVTAYPGQPTLVNNALPITANRAAYDISLQSGTISGQGNVLLPNCLGDLTKREHRFMRSGYSFVTTTGTRSVPGQAFPYAFPLVSGSSLALAEATLNDTTRAGEDVILTNVIAFDVRVYDPLAVVPTVTGTTWRQPGDPGYLEAVASGTAGTGAYVDLGLDPAGLSLDVRMFPPPRQTQLSSSGMFLTVPATADLLKPSQTTLERSFFWSSKRLTTGTSVSRARDSTGLLLTSLRIPDSHWIKKGMIVWGMSVGTTIPFGTFVARVSPPEVMVTNFREDLANMISVQAEDPLYFYQPLPTYDTWSRHYEFNGVDDDNDEVVDEGSNGADADGDGWPEHSTEAETSPPYPTAIRGVEVRLRCYEPTSKQVRQITIRHSFER